VTYRWQWRGAFENFEVTALHGDAFEAGVVVASETDWQSLLANHSLGWVTARDRDQLLGFVNVIWDGQSYAWIQDLEVNSASRHLGVGSELVATACEASRTAGCEWLHVDFEEMLGTFYFDACGFQPTTAGLICLR
jgi:GNAT superfamily N-acetyltransferase